MTLRHRSYVVTTLLLGDDDIAIRFGDLVVARAEGATELDWELVAYATDPEPVDHGAHHLTMLTAEGRDLSGDAIVVRSVDGTHVFRGAGPIAGVDPGELD